MNTQKYTNFVLTVIAICLVYQCLHSGEQPVVADGIQTVNVANWPSEQKVRVSGMQDVNIAAVYGFGWSGRVSDWKRGTLPVSVLNPSLPIGRVDVNVTNRSLPVVFKADEPLPVIVRNGDWYCDQKDSTPSRDEDE
ncbi:MAG: hypothetical protein ACYC2Y_08130 [Armatimonadota bacterium]